MAGAGCTPKRPAGGDKFIVSILPLKNIVENITGTDFVVDVLVPPGASPETYEPTPSQMVAIHDAKLVFTTGLIDFERALMEKLAGQNTENKFIDLSTGITLIKGECAHGGPAHSHGHGVDPHIWSSPRNLKAMAATVMQRIALLYPDSSMYIANYEVFMSNLDFLDRDISGQISAAEVNCFIIYHPALTYYARDYGLQQIAIEHEGKEPAVDKLQQLVNKAKNENVKTIFYQRQFSPTTVEAIARETGARCVEIDPLAEDVIGNLHSITSKICGDEPGGN